LQRPADKCMHSPFGSALPFPAPPLPACPFNDALTVSGQLKPLGFVSTYRRYCPSPARANHPFRILLGILLYFLGVLSLLPIEFFLTNGVPPASPFFFYRGLH